MRSLRHFFPKWFSLITRFRLHQHGATCTSPPWRAFYLAAIFETDKDRVEQRITEARKALVIRARDLFASAGDHLQEQNAIDETLQALQTLERACGVHIPKSGD